MRLPNRFATMLHAVAQARARRIGAAVAWSLAALLLESACNWSRYTSIAVGGDGLGLISYRDGETGVLKAGHCEDTECLGATLSILDSPVDSQGKRVSVGSYSSIAFGRDGLGLISYEEPVGNLRVAHCAGVPCTRANAISIIDNGRPKGRVGTYTSVAIGGDGLG